MRKTTIIAAIASLALAPAAALAQAEPPAPAQDAPAAQPQAPAPSQGQTPEPAPAEAITEVRIIDISELPPETQTQVNQIVSQRSDADLKALRDSLDATPQIAAKMQEQGVSSDQIVAASLDPNGRLTLLTQKAG